MANKTLPLLTFSVIAALSGCLDNSSGDTNDPRTGQLTLTGIEGLRYETASQSGETNSNGEYLYYEGETISFWVGDLQIAAAVPAKPFLTPLDFSEDARTLLQTATSDSLGLSTHTVIEERLAAEDPLAMNIMRMLWILDEDKSNRLGRGQEARNNIKLTNRIIDQFNRALAVSEQPLDFTGNRDSLKASSPTSALNAILRKICFYPEGDLRCAEPTNQSEIDRVAAELHLHLNNGDDSDKAYEDELRLRLQKLRNDNQAIEEGRREVEDVHLESVTDFLVEQTREYNSIKARSYYITPFELRITASDTTMKSLRIKSYRGELDLTGLDAISTNEEAIMVPRWSAQTQEVDFHSTGTSGSEAAVRLSFRPAGDYRWFQAQLRPVIE